MCCNYNRRGMISKAALDLAAVVLLENKNLINLCTSCFIIIILNFLMAAVKRLINFN